MELDSFLRSSKLPTLPAVAVRLMELMTQDVSFPVLAKLLMTDASLSVEVLRAANSPLFGTRSEVKSIPHALTTLGFNRVSMLVVTTALWRSIPGSINRQLVRSWWRHNLATALLAKHMESNGADAEEAGYTAGLLHSVGQLALMGAYPAAYHALLTRAINQNLALSTCEKDAFGMDHCEVGGALLTQWHVPDDIAEAACHHHDPESARHRSTWLVHVACQAANYLGYPVISRHRVAIEDCPDAVRAIIEDEPLHVMIEEKVNALESSLL